MRKCHAITALLAMLAAGPLAAQGLRTPIIAPQGPAAFLLQPGQTATLTVLVTSRAGAPQSNIPVTFVAPPGNPSGQFTGSAPATPYLFSTSTSGSGVATASLVAGAGTGPFLLSAYANGVPSAATFAFTIVPQTPQVATTATVARSAVISQVLNNAVQDELLQLNGPFLLAAGAEALPANGSNPHLFRQSVPAGNLTWFFWVDDAPQAGFEHRTRFVLVDATQPGATQAAAAARVFEQVWWPLVLLPGDARLYSLERPAPPAPSTRIVPAAAAKSGRRFDDAPSDACAIVAIGPGLPGAADDAKAFVDHLTSTSNPLVPAGNIFGKFNQSGQPLPVTRSDLEGYVKQAKEKGCKTVYIMFSTHGGAADSGNAGLKVAQDKPATLPYIPYEDLHTIFEPVKGAKLLIYQNSCYSGLVPQFLQGWGFTGEVVTSADDKHTSYSERGTGSFFFAQLLPAIDLGQTNAVAVATVVQGSDDPKVKTPNPQVVTINPGGPRRTLIPGVFIPDVQGTKNVTIFRPPGATGALTITVQGPAGLGHFVNPPVTMAANQNALTFGAIGDDSGSGSWTVTIVDANNQTYTGTNVFQVGVFRPNTPTLVVALGQTADETLTRYGDGIDRGDVLNIKADTSDSFTIESKDPDIATPVQTPVKADKGQVTFTVSAKGNKVGKTTFTVKNKNGGTRSFIVDVRAATGSSGVSCPDNALFDTVAMVIANPGNHPIAPASGKWQVMRTGMRMMLTGPGGIAVTGTMDSSCHFSGSGPFQIFGFNTRVDVTNGVFVNPPNSDAVPRAASGFAGMQFNYAIGGDGALPTGQAVSFLAQGVLLCSYTVAPSPVNFTAGGGPGTFSILTDAPCPWSPVAGAPWIALGARTPAGSTKGPGIIAFTIAPNSGAARTSSITAAGQFAGTITQDAGNANRPSIDTAGVVNGGSFRSGFTSGAWVTLKGQNLSATTRQWQDSDFRGPLLPTVLDGVSVTMNGKPAYVYYISPGQLNVLAPADTFEGALEVQVSNANGKSEIVTVDRYNLDPSLFMFSPAGAIYPAAIHLDGSYLGPEDLFAGALPTHPAVAGETIVLFGTGFGPTNPPSPADRTAPAAPIAGAVVIRIGGTNAPFNFAGLVSPGVYQFNVVVPDVPAGEQRLEIFVDGVQIQEAVYIPIAPL